MTLDQLSLTNAGTLEAAAGQLVIDTPSLTNTGTLEATGGTLVVASGTFTDLTGFWIAHSGTIELPAPNGFAGIAGDVGLDGTASEFVSSTGTNVPSLTNSYLAPETILAGAALGVFHGATFGIARTPSETIVVGGSTVVSGNSLEPFGNAGLMWLFDGTADLVANVSNTGRMLGYGSLTVSGAVMNNAGGTIEAQGGLLTFTGALSGGELLVDAGSVLDLSSGWFGGGGAVPATFNDTSDLLQINVTDNAGTYGTVGSVAVNGFVLGDTIAVDGTVAGGFAGGTANLLLNQNANHDEIITVACFAAGTPIATPRGAVAVERLQAGDPVCLATGGTASVVWLGHRRVDCRRHKRPDDVLPVRIVAHAFGLDRPRRDVLLSPDHAVFVDGVPIPVRYLINAATVRQQRVAAVTYWHVELPAHGVILADGLPVESYLDTGNRGAFENGGAVVMAHPDFARAIWERQGCAPLVLGGPMLDLVQRRLLAQAFALGYRPTGEPPRTRGADPARVAANERKRRFATETVRRGEE